MERELLSHPSVADVAVGGVDDDPVWGQAVGAVVVLSKEAESLDLETVRITFLPFWLVLLMENVNF